MLTSYSWCCILLVRLYRVLDRDWVWCYTGYTVKVYTLLLNLQFFSETKSIVSDLFLTFSTLYFYSVWNRANYLKVECVSSWTKSSKIFPDHMTPSPLTMSLGYLGWRAVSVLAPNILVCNITQVLEWYLKSSTLVSSELETFCHLDCRTWTSLSNHRSHSLYRIKNI